MSLGPLAGPCRNSVLQHVSRNIWENVQNLIAYIFVNARCSDDVEFYRAYFSQIHKIKTLNKTHASSYKTMIHIRGKNVSIH